MSGRFAFDAARPRLWTGRYARIPGETTAFHVRLADGDWWPFVDWVIGDETAQCPMAEADSVEKLAQAVNAGKRLLGGLLGGAFLVNEHGQVLVPAQEGDRRIAIVGECEGSLEFWDAFNDDGSFDLTDDYALQHGDCWNLPYLGVPHNLSAGSEIYFWGGNEYGGSKLLPPLQDDELIDALRTMRPYGPVRFVVTHGGLVLTKVPVRRWSTASWEARYVGRLDYDCWYAKEV